MKKFASLAVLVACAASLVACAATPATQRSAPGPVTHRIDGDLAKQYTDIASLAHDSAAVIIATPTTEVAQESADAAGQSGVNATVTTVTVVKVLKGSTPAATLRIRQLPVDGIAILVPGKTYVLFVNPFHFATAPDNGEWVVTGAVGSYTVTGTKVVLASSAVPGLPAQLQMTDLVSQLK